MLSDVPAGGYYAYGRLLIWLSSGAFWDFYEWDAYQYNMWGSYMPSTYLVFAVWNIPIKLLGIVTRPERFAANTAVLMWYKLLPVSLYLVSGYLIYKIASVIGMGTKKSKLCAYVFLTTPIGFFSQFMFGQYDIFTVFLILLGIYYYLKDNRRLFVLFLHCLCHLNIIRCLFLFLFCC